MPDELVELEGSHRAPVKEAERLRDVAPGEEVTVTVFVRRVPGSHPVTDPIAEAGKRPRDRRYLSPAESAASYGAAQADLQAVVDYAESKGLRKSAVSTATRSVRVTGPAGALGPAFGVELGYFRRGDLTYRGRVGSVKIPASLSGIVEAVFGFDNRPIGRSYLRAAKAGTAYLSLGAHGAALPANTYLPPQVAGLYGFPADHDGTGETVAVIVFNGDIGSGVSAPGGYHLPALSEYFTQVLDMKAPVLTDVVVQGPGNQPGDGTNPYDVSDEVYLDLCIVGSLAPGAKIAVYFTQFTEQGWVEAISRAATDTVNNPSVISISYGNPENDPRGAWTKMAIKQVNDAFEAAAAAGRTTCCAAGDGGAADEPGTTKGQVDFPASSPWVLACGGTRLESVADTISAEVVWNDLANGNGATGGGVSSIFPRPSWQSGTRAVPVAGVMPPPDGRGVPDVAALADPETPYVVASPGGSLQQVGGTSAAAPLWSALISRFNQALGARVGYLNPLLYSDYPDALRDITSGNNGGYEAGPGWDACTGWGSPGASSLLQAIQGQLVTRIFTGGTAHQRSGQEAVEQRAMTNQLVTFLVLERLLDSRNRTWSEDHLDWPDILPVLLAATKSAAGHAQTPPGAQPVADLNVSQRTTKRDAMPAEATHRQQVAAEADAILISVQQTVYTHETYVDAATGTYDMDCSAYVGYVLQRIAPRHYDTIHNGGGAHGPLAVDFYHRFHALPPGGAHGWRPVQPLTDVRRGDIVAWDFPVIKPGDNTGHVFIAADDPEVFDDGTVAVRAYDSSDVIHYHDTRGQGGDSPATGLGAGTIHFQYADTGMLFQFGPGDPYHDAPVAIGRIEPLAT